MEKAAREILGCKQHHALYLSCMMRRHFLAIGWLLLILLTQGTCLAADQSLALQQALNQRGSVHLAAGLYEFSQTLFIPPNTILEGDGPATRLTYTGTGLAIAVVGQNQIVRSTLRDFRLTTSSGAPYGIRIVDASTVKLADLYVDHFTQIAVHLTSNAGGLAINLILRDCFIQDNPGHGLVGDASVLNANVVSGGRVQGNGGWGMWWWGPRGLLVEGVDVEGNLWGQVHVQGGGGIVFIGNYCENEPGFPLNCPFDPVTNFVLGQ